MTDQEKEEKVEEFKLRGHREMLVRNYKDAIKRYTEAIELDPENPELYYHRSAAYIKQRMNGYGVGDAVAAIKLRPNWNKAHARKGLDFMFLELWHFAVKSYKDGLEKCPDDQTLKDGLKEAEEQKLLYDEGPRRSGYYNAFHDALAMTKMRCNDATKPYLEDKEFYAKMERLCDDPHLLAAYQDQDQRVKAVHGTLLVEHSEARITEAGLRHNRTDLPINTPPPSHGCPRDLDNPYPQPKPLSDSEKAVKEKEKGNEAYQTKDFTTAGKHYEKAIELDPSSMTYLLNLAAVYKEQGEYQKCAETSLKAVEVGRENRADYKQIAKAFARCALAYSEMEDFEQAKSYYEKALSEHSTPESRDKLSEVEQAIKEIAENVYRDPKKAEEERSRGNELFKKGDFPGAAKAYTEAIKRNPQDPKLYSNRAACYNKLVAFDLGVKDCDACIKIDPTFIKGYLRKGVLLMALQQFDKAMEAFQKAIELDENNTEAITGYRECMMSMDNDLDLVKKRALDDPEVQELLGDPDVRLILEKMVVHVDFAKEQMMDPKNAAMLQKLLQCGMILYR